MAEHVQWIKEMIRDTSDDSEDGQNSDDNQISAPSDAKSDLTSTSEEDNNSKGAAGLKCLASNGKFCKFPFEFRGKVKETKNTNLHRTLYGF